MIPHPEDVCRKRPVLVVDDEPLMREFVCEALRRAGYAASPFAEGTEAIAAIREERPALVISDLVMPGCDGLELLRWIHQNAPEVGVLVMTAHADVASAVEAMRLGAFDYVEKPFLAEHLVLLAGSALQRGADPRTTPRPCAGVAASRDGEWIVGEDPSIVRLREDVQRLSASEINVLVCGETGTGKELVACALHRLSRRGNGPFVAVNCAALPETLVASEFFGHERGSFTSAMTSRIGRFEAAQAGTLFLDEIGDLPPSAQGTLLRVLQEKHFERVGSSRTLEADFRLVSATRLDLQAAVSAGRFREDLYFRINVARLRCPPLRDRRGDIPLLVTHFLRGMSGLPTEPPEVTRSAMAKLVAHPWPGNVRELQNVLARAALRAPAGRIRDQDIDLDVPVLAVSGTEPSSLSLHDVEALHIRHVLEICHGNQSKAARLLHIDRSTLHRKMLQHGIPPAEPGNQSEDTGRG